MYIDDIKYHKGGNLWEYLYILDKIMRRLRKDSLQMKTIKSVFDAMYA